MKQTTAYCHCINICIRKRFEIYRYQYIEHNNIERVQWAYELEIERCVHTWGETTPRAAWGCLYSSNVDHALIRGSCLMCHMDWSISCQYIKVTQARLVSMRAQRAVHTAKQRQSHTVFVWCYQVSSVYPPKIDKKFYCDIRYIEKNLL